MSRKQSRASRWVAALSQYFTFFLLIASVVTCCMLLFLETLQANMEMPLTQELIETAAQLTFGNVVLISFLCTVIDSARRWFMVTRPVQRIADAARKITQGDFSVRIQTPLAVIQNYGTMLQQPGLTEEQRQGYAKTVTDASRRLADLITNILKLNKLENQQIYPEKEAFDLGEQLCECLLSFEDIWEEKNIELVTDISEDVIVKSDRSLLSLVWNNLFSNALKFTPAEGRVSVSLKVDGAFAAVQVSDTGCGISRSVGAHIFEKFYQGDTSHATQGNGLGLALVKRVIDIVDGDISVSSEVGRGSIFTVTIRSAENGAF